MNYVIITAAGSGTRANLGIPKQFYEVNNVPLIVYTLKAFDAHPLIDEIILVLDSEHYKSANNYFEKFDIKKLKHFCVGGSTNELSIYNAFKFLKKIANDNDIAIVHDGVRCLVDENTITNNIEICKKYGNAITAIPCNEAMLYTEDGCTSKSSIDRRKMMKTQTPHSIYFKEGFDLLKKSVDSGNIDSVALCTLLIENNKKVYFSKGNNCNFKVTNPEDILLFESYLNNK